MPICAAPVMAARIFFALGLALFVAAGPVIGQGRSDTAPGKTKEKSKSSGSTSSSTSSSRASQSGLGSPVTATASTSAPAASANAVAYFGSWLDDASIVAPGDVWVGLATGYWRGDSNRQIDAPVASAAVGITPRLQAGGSASFYHFRDAEGISENGFGSFSLYGKFLIADPLRAPNAIGVAVTPLIEFSPGSDAPVGWALPVNLETRRGDLRVLWIGRLFLQRIGFRNDRGRYSRKLARLHKRHVWPVLCVARERIRRPSALALRWVLPKPAASSSELARPSCRQRSAPAGSPSPGECPFSSQSHKRKKYNRLEGLLWSGTETGVRPSNLVCIYR